jgi:hypothetical protein
VALDSALDVNTEGGPLVNLADAPHSCAIRARGRRYHHIFQILSDRWRRIQSGDDTDIYSEMLRAMGFENSLGVLVSGLKK